MAKAPKMRAGGPSWRPGDPTLTVGEIAARLTPIAPDIEGTISKVRHWGREGLMIPVANRGEGTGRHRLYAEGEVYAAAILMVTTGAGMNVASTRFLIDALRVAKYTLPEWRKSRRPLYLKIDREASPRSRTAVEFLHEPPGKPESDLTIVIDLARLWTRIE
jgi:DNA-binding transcriptional MerR regulator